MRYSHQSELYLTRYTVYKVVVCKFEDSDYNAIQWSAIIQTIRSTRYSLQKDKIYKPYSVLSRTRFRQRLQTKTLLNYKIYCLQLDSDTSIHFSPQTEIFYKDFQSKTRYSLQTDDIFKYIQSSNR